MVLDISKSTRHQKIIGNFGEHLICNWLSRSGFEVSIVDHTGIDLIAYNPKSKERLGITVKSRTRNIGSEEESVTIFRKKNNSRKKVIEACKAFGCKPYIGIYVETASQGDLYLTSLENYDKKYGNINRVTDDWKMRKKDKGKYKKDPEVKHIIINFNEINWWSSK